LHGGIRAEEQTCRDSREVKVAAPSAAQSGACELAHAAQLVHKEACLAKSLLLQQQLVCTGLLRACCQALAAAPHPVISQDF
jgi:hypothetical protein